MMTTDIPPDPSRVIPTPSESLNQLAKEYKELYHKYSAIVWDLRQLIRRERANLKVGGRHPEAMLDAFQSLLEE